MTLIAAVVTSEGVWMGGDRYAGDFLWEELAGPKIFELATPDDHRFAIGFAGSPRVAQAVVAVPPPARSSENHSLHWWLTTYMNAIHDNLSPLGLLRDGENGPELVGDSAFVIGVERQAVYVLPHLGWEAATRGYTATGGAWSTWSGAFEVLRDHHEAVDAARRAWPYAQRRHRIGPLADEITITAS